MFEAEHYVIPFFYVLRHGKFVPWVILMLPMFFEVRGEKQQKPKTAILRKIDFN